MKNILAWALEVGRKRWQSALAFALVLGFELYNITAAAFWGDEAATISASTRTISQLFNLVRHVDAVHAVYYLGMHFWIQAFGPGELSLRLPEAIAASAAAAILFVILKKRTNTFSAIAATMAFAMMPRVVWAAGIGRSYAFTILFGVILTWILLRITETKKAHRGWFFAYFAIAGFASVIFVFVLLMVAAQGLSLLLLRVSRANLWRFGLAALGAVAVAMPVAIAAKKQSFQIAWLSHVPPDAVNSIFGSVLFYSTNAVTITFWSLVAIGLALLIWRRSRFGKTEKSASLERLALPSVVVALLPSTLIYVYSMFNKSLFDGRYFSFSAGAVAVLVAIAIYQLNFNWVRLVALISVFAITIGPAVYWRQEYRFGNDYDQLSSLIQNQAKPGDAVLFAPLSKHCTGVCASSAAYPEAYKNLKIIGLLNENVRFGYLHDRFLPNETTVKQASHFKRVWYVTNVPADQRFDKGLVPGLLALGFRPTATHSLKFDSATLYTR